MKTAHLRLLFVTFSICALAVFSWYFWAGNALLEAAYDGRSWSVLNKVLGHADRHPLAFYVQKMDALASFYLLLWLAFTVTAAVFLYRLHRPAAKSDDGLDYLLFAIYTAMFAGMLLRFGTQESWYLIDDIMAFKGMPPFQHRVMFIFPAQVLQYLFPRLGAIECFLWSQVLAVMLMLWSVRRFAALFIRRDLAFVAQFLVFCMWAPTVTYYTFYDIGIIFVYSFCLYHLLRREMLPYVAMLVAGTFNHEITLFLIVASGFVLLGQMKLRSLAGWILLQLLLYGLVRVLMFYVLPAHQAWEGGKIANNINLFLHHPRTLVQNLGPILLWYLVAASGWRYASAPLRRCLIILPCLLTMTLMVGQFNEGRQFDAFIPVAVAFMLCALSARVGAPAMPTLDRDGVWLLSRMPASGTGR